MRINAVIIALVCSGAPAVALAQEQQRPLLDQAESAVTSGVFKDARVLLEEWRQRNPSSSRADQEAQARYHILAARVTTNADSAEDHYLTVAVNYPTSRVAPDALVRLAQARHARGDVQQAVDYLQRVLADYPSTDQRALAAVWLTRLQTGTMSGTNAGARNCDLLRSVEAGNNVEIIELLKAERTRVCSPSNIAASTPAPARPKPADTARVISAAPPKTSPAVSRPVATDTARKAPAKTTIAAPIPTPAAAAPSSPTARVAVQVGAFRELAGARAVLQQLQRDGYPDARLVRVLGNTLIRVRVGRFASGSAAAPLLARLAAADISAVLVTDVQNETPVRDQ